VAAFMAAAAEAATAKAAIVAAAEAPTRNLDRFIAAWRPR